MFVAPLFLAVQQSLAVADAPAYPGTRAAEVAIPRIEAEAVVDGRLDEPVWAQAARLTGFSQYEPVDGRPAEERTEVLVWYAPDAIHFGILAHDRQPGAIRATVADRDAIGGDDHVVLYLDTFNDRRRAFFFAVNPLGVQEDGVRTESAATPGRIFGGSIDKSPDYWFESKGRITDEGYVVEVRIPFKSLRYPGNGPQHWGFQVERKVQRTGYVDTWTPARRASASFLGQAGTLAGLRDLRRGIVFEAQPVVTAVADGVRDPATGAFDRGSLEPEVGVNLRVGFTSLSIDATVNPDFSQVEADVGQVTINERFALFFPEKRPFFLEGIELFATPNQLVHTRQVANPKVGGKVTGKVGGVAIAHMTALDEVAGGDALFNVTRLRRDFGRNSLAGVTFTDRGLLDGGDRNRVLAADVRYVFGGMYYAEAQLGRSWTREGTVEGDAPIWKLELDRTGRRWGFNYRLNGVGEDFVARAGFVNRDDIVELRAFNRLSFYGDAGAAVERFTVFFGPNRLWRYGELGRRSALEGSESLNIEARLRGGWEVAARPRRDFFELDPRDYAAFEVADGGVLRPYAPLDRVAGYFVELGVNTPTFRRFDAELSATRGRVAIFDEGAEGAQTGVDGELSLRPDASVRLALSGTYQRITRARDGSEFARSIIPRAKLEFQPTRALFFRAIGEWRAERRAALEDARTGLPLHVGGAPVPATQIDGLRVDLLASYEPAPGTVAFLGYGSSLDAEDTFRFSRLRRTADGFFFKLAYQFRR